MKKIALSAVSLAALTTSAFAADLPSRKEPVIAPSPPPMWTGFHVGINAGGTWSNNSNVNVTTWNTSAPTAIDNDLNAAALLSGSVPTSVSSGFIGGGQIGYDWQGNLGGYGFVAGVEADIQGIAGNAGSGSRTIPSESVRVDVGSFHIDDDTYTTQKATANLNYIGTVRGRLGFLATPTLLIYGTGGLAYGGVNMSLSNYQPTYLNSTFPGLPSGLAGVVGGYQGYSNTQVGWTAGGGLEWMAMSNWSVKAEYLYYDLGNASATTVNVLYPSLAGASTEVQNVSNFSTRFNGNIVRAGVNYHFNFASAPVVAKY